MKPRSPRDLRFLWGRDAVTVVCPDLPYSGLLYQVQHKTPFDTEWQVRDQVPGLQGRVGKEAIQGARPVGPALGRRLRPCHGRGSGDPPNC